MLKNMLRLCLMSLVLGCGGDDDDGGDCQRVAMYEACTQTCQCPDNAVCADQICIPD
jgi:hypothetical protein